LERAAPKTALEYLEAMAEAARRPRPGAADSERDAEASNMVEGEGAERCKRRRAQHAKSRFP